MQGRSKVVKNFPWKKASDMPSHLIPSALRDKLRKFDEGALKRTVCIEWDCDAATMTEGQCREKQYQQLLRTVPKQAVSSVELLRETVGHGAHVRLFLY